MSTVGERLGLLPFDEIAAAHFQEGMTEEQKGEYLFAIYTRARATITEADLMIAEQVIWDRCA